MVCRMKDVPWPIWASLARSSAGRLAPPLVGSPARRSSLRKSESKPSRLSRLKLEMNRDRTGLRAGVLLPVLVTALVVSLGIAALRIDLLRVRYALAAATLEEQRLLD